jgi:hypothetical protein
MTVVKGDSLIVVEFCVFYCVLCVLSFGSSQVHGNLLQQVGLAVQSVGPVYFCCTIFFVVVLLCCEFEIT